MFKVRAIDPRQETCDQNCTGRVIGKFKEVKRDKCKSGISQLKHVNVMTLLSWAVTYYMTTWRLSCRLIEDTVMVEMIFC